MLEYSYRRYSKGIFVHWSILAILETMLGNGRLSLGGGCRAPGSRGTLSKLIQSRQKCDGWIIKKVVKGKLDSHSLSHSGTDLGHLYRISSQTKVVVME